MNEIKYRFSPNVKKSSIRKIKLIDKLLYVFFKGPDRTPLKPDIKEITIMQLAHIGDLILMLPALKLLKSTTNYKINLVVSSQNFSIASTLKYVDTVAIADAPWFARNKKIPYSTFIAQLRKIKTDLVFDVRGDLRNIVFIKIFTNKKIFAGYNVAGGEALLDVSLPYPHGEHITGLLNPLFDYLQLPEKNFNDYWNEDDVPHEIVNDLAFPDNFLIVHLGTGAESRKWAVNNFIETITSVSKDIPVYVLGTSQDLTAEQLEVIKTIPNVTSCVGKYSILQSIYILKKCSMFLGLDSGFSHIAAMFRKKVFVLFSGSANKNVWKPYSFYQDQVVLVKRTVACDLDTGCGKLVCADNICMKQIYPFEIISLLRSHIMPAEASL